MSSEGSSARKPRKYYVDYSNRNNKYGQNKWHNNPKSTNSRFGKTPDLSFGNKGFLITSIDEVKSYLEMRNILEEYFELLYKEDIKEEGGDGGGVDDKVGEKTIEDELESELKQLRVNRPFKQVKTHCKNTLFINIVSKFQHVDPILIVDKLFEDLIVKQELNCCNTFKVLPILDTFRTSLSCAKEAVSNVLISLSNDETEKKTYFIEFQSRGNYKLSSEDKQKWVEGVAQKVTDLRPNWTVNRENADYMIVLIALKELCCVTFLKDYFKRCKYNVKELLPKEEVSEVKVQQEEEEKLEEKKVQEEGEE